MSKKIKLILAVMVALIIATSALVVGVAALDNEPTLEIEAANVSFESTVHLWYCVGYENIETPNDVKLLVWREAAVTNVENCVKGTESAMLNATGDVNEDGIVGKSFDFDGLTAADMTEFIYARAYAEIDGKAVYSPVVKYSILQYALNKTGKTGTATENAELFETLEAMLVYGAASQKLFDTNLDRLATDDYVKISTNVGSFADGSTTSLFKVGEEVKVYADADNGYVYWNNADGKMVGTGAEYTFVANDNVKLSATTSDTELSFGAYKHVVLIGVDGAGDFYWGGKASTPNINEIFAENSAITRTMKINAPTSSGPSWTSITHGTLVEHHGVNDNYLVEGATGQHFPLDSKYPSFLRLVKEAYPNQNVDLFYGWAAFDYIVEENVGINKMNPDELLAGVPSDPDLSLQARIDKQVTVNALNSIAGDMPSLLFLHYGNVDTVGHAKNWNSDDYHAELTNVDAYIGEIYAALEAKGILEDTLFIVTADHGGYNGENRHGSISDAEQMVMFAAKGRTVNPGQIGEMENRDVAAVVLMALGVAAPDTYTAKVPGNLFSDVAATERKIYNDPDSPRYHLTEQTPAKDSAEYIANFVSNNLSTYITFDGSIDVTGKLALGEQKGTLTFEPGYFGEALSLEHGSFQLTGFTPDTNSFTMAFWVKMPTVTLESPIVANRAYSNFYDGYPGFILHGIRPGNDHQVGVRFYANNTVTNANTYLPKDYQYGWLHITMIMDRENNRLGLAHDFGEIQWTALPEDAIGKTLTTNWQDLWFGVDADGSHYAKSDYTIDEFMIFDGAISRNELNDLSEYFGKTPTVEDEKTLLDILNTSDSNLSDTVYFDFDNNANNNGDQTTVNTSANMVYSTGFKGQGMETGYGKSYVELADYKFNNDSYSIAMWVKVNDLTKPSNGTYEYEALFSNVTKYGGKADGITLYISSWWGAGTGNNTPFINFNASTGTDRVSGPFAYLPGDASLYEWMHIALTVDRSANGSVTAKLYINFTEVAKTTVSYGEDADMDSATSNLTIGNFSPEANYPNPLEAVFDEVIVTKGVLTADDFAAMAEFYGVN